MSLAVYSLSFNMFSVNTYIVVDTATNNCAIIDPGMMNDIENNNFVNFINSCNLNPVILINTHLHIDHVMGNDFVTSTFRLVPYAHISDKFLGAKISEQAKMFGLNINIKNIENQHFVEEGEYIQIGESKLKVIHVPGHSPGSIVLYSEVDKFIISGDALFQQSIGRTDLPGGDYSSLIFAIQNKLLCLSEETKVYPGHGGPTTIGYEKLNNPFL